MASTEYRIEERNGARWLITPLGELGWMLDSPDPGAGLYLALAAPPGLDARGITNMPALIKGDPGFPPSLELSSFTVLDVDDPNPDSFAITLIAPATDISGPVYGVDVVMHKGAKGDPGDATWDPTDLSETPQLGYIPAVAAGLTGFELVPQRVGNTYWPATITSVPTGTTAGFTMATVPIEAAPFDRTVSVEGTARVTGSSTSLVVDLVARLDDETAGAVVGRCYGLSGQTDRLILTDAPDAGASLASIKIPAGQSTNVYFRTEKQSGSATYSALAAYSRFKVRTEPLP